MPQAVQRPHGHGHGEHNYPSYYPQAESNPQTPWAYPDAALPQFRRWFRNEYLLTKFPPYILSKAKLLPGGKLEAEQIVALFDQKVISGQGVQGD